VGNDGELVFLPAFVHLTQRHNYIG